MLHGSHALLKRKIPIEVVAQCRRVWPCLPLRANDAQRIRSNRSRARNSVSSLDNQIGVRQSVMSAVVTSAKGVFYKPAACRSRLMCHRTAYFVFHQVACHRVMHSSSASPNVLACLGRCTGAQDCAAYSRAPVKDSEDAGTPDGSRLFNRMTNGKPGV